MKIYQELNDFILNLNIKHLTAKRIRYLFEQNSDIHLSKRALICYIYRTLERLEREKIIKLTKKTHPKIYKKRRRN